MQLAMLQYPCGADDWEKRIADVASYADIAIMPELFYGKTVPPLKEWAQKYDIALIGSYWTEDHQNAAFFQKPDGELTTMGKRHLYGWEKNKFTPGEDRLIVEYKDWKICVLVCYDLRFPAWSRNQTGWDYDLLCYVANFPASRCADWDLLLQARSLENQAYVCGVNRTGVDSYNIEYNGHSAVYLGPNVPFLPGPEANQSTPITNPDFSILNNKYIVPPTEPGTYLVEIFKDKVIKRREAFPCWKDNDSYSFNS